MKISLGPVLYYWNREQLLDFYAKVATSDVDIVYVGEVVCSKRRALGVDEWIALAHDLARESGKEVVLSSLTLIEAESELGVVRRMVRELAARGELAIEANDFGAVQAAAEAGIPFIAGHTLNVYNAQTLARLVKRGAKRWVAPVEIGRDSLASLVAAARADQLAVETEVFSWGRLPLAHSARCFTARAHNLPKDQCGFRCADDIEGLTLSTREATPLFQLNGIQTQSAGHCNLFGEAADMARRGVDIMRISVSTPDSLDLVNRLVAQARGTAAMLPPVDADLCNGYWFGKAGILAS